MFIWGNIKSCLRRSIQDEGRGKNDKNHLSMNFVRYWMRAPCSWHQERIWIQGDKRAMGVLLDGLVVSLLFAAVPALMPWMLTVKERAIRSSCTIATLQRVRVPQELALLVGMNWTLLRPTLNQILIFPGRNHFLYQVTCSWRYSYYYSFGLLKAWKVCCLNLFISERQTMFMVTRVNVFLIEDPWTSWVCLFTLSHSNVYSPYVQWLICFHESPPMQIIVCFWKILPFYTVFSAIIP